MEKQVFVRRWYFVRHGESQNNAINSHDAPSVDEDEHISSSSLLEPTPSQLSSSVLNRLPDPSLTPLGEKQAFLAAKWINENIQNKNSPQNDNIHHIHNSDIDKHLHNNQHHHTVPSSFTVIERIFCSPMLRALETAKEIQQVLNVPVEVIAPLFEQGGLFQGTRNSIVSSAKTYENSDHDTSNKNGENVMTGSSTIGINLICLSQNFPYFHVNKHLWKLIVEKRFAKKIDKQNNCNFLKNMQSLGWWNGQRETIHETVERIHLIIKWMIFESMKNESGAQLVVCHGLIQDLIMKALMYPFTYSRNDRFDEEEQISNDSNKRERNTFLKEMLNESIYYHNVTLPSMNAYFLSRNCSLSCVDIYIVINKHKIDNINNSNNNDDNINNNSSNQGEYIIIANVENNNSYDDKSNKKIIDNDNSKNNDINNNIINTIRSPTTTTTCNPNADNHHNDTNFDIGNDGYKDFQNDTIFSNILSVNAALITWNQSIIPSIYETGHSLGTDLRLSTEPDARKYLEYSSPEEKQKRSK